MNTRFCSLLALARTAEVDLIGLDERTSRRRELELEVRRDHGQETREESERRETHGGSNGDSGWYLLLAVSREKCCVPSSDLVQEFMRRRRDSASSASAYVKKLFHPVCTRLRRFDHPCAVARYQRCLKPSYFYPVVRPSQHSLTMCIGLHYGAHTYEESCAERNRPFIQRNPRKLSDIIYSSIVIKRK